MNSKEQIMIDGVNVNKCIDFNKRDKVSCYHILYDKCDESPNCYFKQLARKTQECEKLEDFRTLTRDVFTFGDSDVDDENFIKYLQEYSRSYEEAIDGYYRLTDITGIDYTVHGGADIEEIIKRVDILKQECDELKNNLHIANTNHDAAEKECDRYRKALEPFQDEYFKGLDTTVIAELAKKSIRITKEHCSDLQKIEELQQECKKLKERATIAEDNFACEVQARLYHQNEWLKFSNECEELKKQLKTSEKWRIKAESLNEKLELRNDRYREALDEIEDVIKTPCAEDWIIP